MRRREFIAGLGAAALAGICTPAVRAQQKALPTIGYLGASRREGVPRPRTADFIQGLNEQGYVEGRNFEVLYRFADNRYDRLPALAADLVRRRVNVIIASGNPAAVLAAKQATAAIPIVFTTGVDPVEFGLVASFNRPGGNITGVSFLTTALTAKRRRLISASYFIKKKFAGTCRFNRREFSHAVGLPGGSFPFSLGQDRVPTLRQEG